MQGWLALARPSQGHLQRDARKVGRLQGARKERPPVASLQGATPTARATASRGSDVDRKSGCRWARAAVACAGVAFEVTLPKLLNMLRETESTIKKEKPVLYIGGTKKKRKASKTLKKGKGKGRLGKAKVAKKYSAKDKGQCFHCSQDKHWKRNCKDYLAFLLET
ncbi:hypothetical protein BHM03_00056988 [Ensete ventricosum]|nr:hypothetical protein BHM03_00056988 [Ensete ventricosum]